MGKIKRGGIYYADLGRNNVGSVQGGVRPVLILQNDVGNLFSPTVIVAPLTSRTNKHKLPVHLYLSCKDIYGLKFDSVVLFEQIRTIDKIQLKSKITELSECQMNEMIAPISISLGISVRQNNADTLVCAPVCA